MLSFPFNFVILSVIFGTSCEKNSGISRSYFSDKLVGKTMDTKLQSMELYFPRGIFKILTRPVGECEIKLWNGKKVETAYMLQTHELERPFNASWSYQKGHYYTLFLGDIDNEKEYKSENGFRAHCKWLVSNIPGCEIHKGKSIFAYSSPKKRPPRELRRYVVFIYDQQFNEPINFTEGGYFDVDQMGDFLHLDSSKERTDFQIQKFADWYNFGPPMAANLYSILDGI